MLTRETYPQPLTRHQPSPPCHGRQHFLSGSSKWCMLVTLTLPISVDQLCIRSSGSNLIDNQVETQLHFVSTNNPTISGTSETTRPAVCPSGSLNQSVLDDDKHSPMASVRSTPDLGANSVVVYYRRHAVKLRMKANTRVRG